MADPDPLSTYLLAAGPAPCDDCRFRARCAVELLACEAYSLFVHEMTARRWRSAPRAPNRARYEALFDGRSGRRRKVRPEVAASV